MVEATIDKEKLTAAKEAQATITFDIPAYVDDAGRSFQRVVKVATKKAYAIYKRLVE